MILASCSGSKNKAGGTGKKIARVGKEFLFESDLAGVGHGAAKPEDSVAAVKNYIDSWVRHQLELSYAQDNLPDELPDVDEQMKNYRESLIIYTYEKELIAQKLDTTIDEKTLQDYYEKNIVNFELKTPIGQVKFLVLKNDLFPKKIPVRIDSVRKWLKFTSEWNSQKLTAFADKYATRASVSDSTWTSTNELSAIITSPDFNVNEAFFTHSYSEFSDSNYFYMVKFNEFKFKGSVAPYNFVRNQIMAIIVNQKKRDFIKLAHDNIYNDARKNNKFEIY